MNLLITLTDVDLVVVEWHPILNIDEHLVFRNDTFGDSVAFRGVVNESKLKKLRRSIEFVETGSVSPATGLTAKDVENEVEFVRKLLGKAKRDFSKYQKKYADSSSGTNKGKAPAPMSYAPIKERWLKLANHGDISKAERVWSHSANLALESLRTMAALCQQKGIGLIVYVPPVAPDIRKGHPEAPPLAATAGEVSLASLRMLAQQFDFDVLNFYAHFESNEYFYDSLHLSPRGAFYFNPVFFEETKKVLRKRAGSSS